MEVKELTPAEVDLALSWRNLQLEFTGLPLRDAVAEFNRHNPTKLVVGDLTMDLLARDVQRADEKIELQPREFALLEYLMRNPNRTVTKTMILEHIFDYSFDPQTNVVDVLVHRLRSKVDKDRAMLHTIRGVGYVLRPA